MILFIAKLRIFLVCCMWIKRAVKKKNLTNKKITSLAFCDIFVVVFFWLIFCAIILLCIYCWICFLANMFCVTTTTTFKATAFTVDNCQLRSVVYFHFYWILKFALTKGSFKGKCFFFLLLRCFWFVTLFRCNVVVS